MKRNIIEILNAKGVIPDCTICGHTKIKVSDTPFGQYIAIKCSRCHHVMFFDGLALDMD